MRLKANIFNLIQIINEAYNESARCCRPFLIRIAHFRVIYYF